MKQRTRRITDLVPLRRTILRAYYYTTYYIKAGGRVRAVGVDGVFSRIYRDNSWESDESVSGPGSTIEYTKNIREGIPRIIDRLGVKRIIDAPCGDYNWFRLIERGEDVSYIGGDIVDGLVISNQKEYGNDYTRFVRLDIINDELPEADLWLCRDCFQHLSNNDILKVIRNFLNSDIRYLLASTYTECKRNRNTPTGVRARPLNLELPPFSLCKPILSICDGIEGSSVRQRHLALWEKRQLSESLASNKALQRLGSTVR
jgi:hypothetical protein